MPDSTATLAFRVTALERQARESTNHGERLSVQDEKIATLTEDVKELTAAVSKIVWSLVGFSFTVAGSAVAVVLAAGM